MKSLQDYTKEEVEGLSAENIDDLEINQKEWLDKNTGFSQDEREQLSKREYKEILLLILFPNSVKC